MATETEIYCIEQMIGLSKAGTFSDPLDGAIQLQDALFMQRNAETFFSEAKLHRHGKIVRLSLYRNHYPEPVASIAMTYEDLHTLQDHLNTVANDNGKCFNCGQSLGCENCGK